jgi:hypothetical protein
MINLSSYLNFAIRRIAGSALFFGRKRSHSFAPHGKEAG